MNQTINLEKLVLCSILSYWSHKLSLILRGVRRELKGQLISKCAYEKSVLSKIPTKIFLDFCPEIFCTFLGASWKLFWASCRLPYLWYYLLSPKEAKKVSKKPPGGHSMTTWTQFCPFLTTTYLYVDIFNPERGQK